MTFTEFLVCAFNVNNHQKQMTIKGLRGPCLWLLLKCVGANGMAHLPMYCMYIVLCNAWHSLSWCAGSTHVHGGTCLNDFPIKLHTWRVTNYYTLINISGFAFKLSLNFVKETISQEGTSQPTLSNCPLLESEDAHITSNINIYYIYTSFFTFWLRRVYLWEGL